MRVQAFPHEPTGTLTYVVWDAGTADALVIDPVLDYDARTVDVSEDSLAPVIDFCRTRRLTVHWVLETHVHADHLSGQQGIKVALDAKSAISARICEVQRTFKDLLGLPENMPTDGSQWDRLLREGQGFSAGALTIEPIATPGHTPACTTLKIRDAVFTGDALFMPDFGTGRCDFPGGSASDLYDSIQKLYTLPGDTRVFVGHDYGPGGRDLAWETTIDASRTQNKSCPADRARADFVAWRTARDATLSPPALLFPSLTLNADAGRLPAPAENGRRYIRLPMGVFS
jgi:glyoxylase-like metal-dependent hydrolase (beta-lactamase superfamily II)